MIDTRTVGKTIAALRQQKGMSQQALAEMCSVTHQAVSKWENGLALPDIQTLLQLSRHFGVSMEDILSGNIPAQGTEDVQADAAPTAPASETEEPADICEEPEAAADDSVQGMDWDQIRAMLPFASQETVDKILLDALQNPKSEKPDMHIIMSILPFASREAVEALVTRAMDSLDADMLPALAPFVSPQFLADLVRNNDDLMSGKNAELLQRIIAFLPSDLVDELLRNNAANGLRWKMKGQKGRVRYNFDLDLGNMRKLQNIGKHIGDTLSSVFSNFGASLQSDAPETPETSEVPVTPADCKEAERPLMRIARKAVEDENIDWLEEHFSDLRQDEMAELCYTIASQEKWHIAAHISDDLSSDQLHLFAAGAVRSANTDWLESCYDGLSSEDQEMVCRLIAQTEQWDLMESIDLDDNPAAARILLDVALEKGATDIVTRILEMWDLDGDILKHLCQMAAESKNWELMRSLCEEVDDEGCLRILLDAAILEGNWDIINLISENM